jgi:hypothetical protein
METSRDRDHPEHQSGGEGPPPECNFVITNELIETIKKIEEENFASKFPNLAAFLKSGKRIST